MADDTTDDRDDASTATPPSERPGDDGDASEGGQTADTGDEPADTGDDRVPLSDLADRISERGDRAEGDAAERDELFEEVRVSELDDEDVWTSLVGDESPDGDAVGTGAEAEPVEGSAGGVDHVVPKAEFCQRCAYFGDPPTLECTHEGTAIVDVPDADHFRVRNCPMVDGDGD